MLNESLERIILVVEDEPETRIYFEMALRHLGYGVEHARGAEEALELLERGPRAAAALIDFDCAGGEAWDTLRAIRRTAPGMPIIAIYSEDEGSSAAEFLQAGAGACVAKPAGHEEIRAAIEELLDLPARAPVPVAAPAPAPRLVPATSRHPGVCASVRELYAMAARVGWSEAPVLIHGETGSGKEVLARELHASSPRASKPFLKLNCAALPSELVESELFGYERGAFTGAFQRKMGMFELSDGGTILLDEIGDMDVRLQAKLLQVLQDHEFQRLGGRETIRVDVRVIAATHRDLELAIADRTFREDLYYRLNVITLRVPSLRERREDIIPLAEHLMRRHAAGAPLPPLTPELRHAMNVYAWPGNVRELENFARKYLILRNADALASELHAKTSSRAAGAAGSPAEPRVSTGAPAAAAPILEQVTKAKQQAEADAILAALHSTRWNRKQAARFLRIDYKALLYKMKKLGIDERAAGTGQPGAEAKAFQATA